jgi:hypothetical protein
MSLETQIRSLAVRAATEDKSIRTLVNGNAANLTALTTTAKTNLVAAINEVKAATASAAGINDTTTGTASTWSSTKTDSELTARINAAVSALVNGAPTALDTFAELAAQLATDESAAAALTTAVGNRLRFDAAQTLTAPQKTQGLTNLGAADATAVGNTAADFVSDFVTALA